MLATFEVDLCYSRVRYESDLLTSRLIRQDSLAIVVPEAHPIVAESDITPKALGSERFILPTLTDGEAFQMGIDQVFSRYGIEPRIQFESDFGSVILSLVEKGLGVSVIPYSYSLARHSGVRFIKLPLEVPLYLNWRKEEENAVIRNVLDIAAQ